VWIIVAGWLAAVLVFSSFFMRTMIPLRIAAIASNVAFIAYALLGFRYGVFDRLYPILVLHSTLLPLNVIRLRELKRMIASVRASSADEAIQALIPYMRVEHHQPGEVIFRRGDPATQLYVVQQGNVRLRETGKRISAGGVFGEVGLFAPQGVRSLTAVCDDECRLATIGADKVLELYYQNPRFGFFLIRLISGLVLEDHARAADGSGDSAQDPHPDR
jgi:CRP/FNR family transcriptional regulator, cyclic AMP receptor protein